MFEIGDEIVCLGRKRTITSKIIFHGAWYYCLDDDLIDMYHENLLMKATADDIHISAKDIDEVMYEI